MRPLLEDPDDRKTAHERAWALRAAAWLSSEMGEARWAIVWAEEALAWFDRHPDYLGRPRAQLARRLGLPLIAVIQQ